MMHFISLLFGYVQISFRGLFIVFLMIFIGLLICSLGTSESAELATVLISWLFFPGSSLIAQKLSTLIKEYEISSVGITIFIFIAEMFLLRFFYYSGKEFANRTGNIHKL